MGLLDGKIAVITGVGPGMGEALARAFAREGCALALGARNAARLEALAHAIEADGGRAIARATDLSDAESCHALVEHAAGELGGIDLLVQNGHHEGDWTRGAEADIDAWHHVMEVNFFGAVHLVKGCVPHMRERGGGAIVLVNSGAAVRQPASMGAYASAKAALAAYVGTLANELGGDQIRVNGVYLGPVLGDNLIGAGRTAAEAAGITIDAWLAAKASELPLGKIPTPEDCAGSVLFLASPLAGAVTGQNIAVNGGQWTTT